FEADGRAPLPLDPAKVWYRFRDRMVAKAVHRYVESDSVETDRLHGMLLALLLGKPVRVRDNGYGKLGSYLETWLPTEAGTADAPASRRAI
ncbi:MAG TPA: hypothetical protein VEB23_16535, partial [Ramlibacter sp.]|nr:hypothetical protein [Ramlibacter sp.]